MTMIAYSHRAPRTGRLKSLARAGYWSRSRDRIHGRPIFATAAFPPGEILDETKMGALLSFVALPLAVALGRAVGLHPKKRAGDA